MLVGLAFALAEFLLFGALIRRAFARGERGRGTDILDMVRKGQLIVFPLAGFVAGSILAGSNGVS